MPTRVPLLGAIVLALIGVGFALLPAAAQQIHRHGFAGKQTALTRGEANVRADEKEHDISTLMFKTQPSSEHIRIATEAGTGDAAYVYYYYETPQAPISPLMPQ